MRGRELGEEQERQLASQVEPAEPPAMRATSVTFTATPASASAHWPGDWAEGTASHRAEVAALEGEPAPPLAVDRWESGDPVDLGALEDEVVVLAFWAAWRERSRKQMMKVARAVSSRRGHGARLVLIRSGENGNDIESFLSDMGAHVSAGVDEEGGTMAAYGADSFPDYQLIADGGRLICADVANEHIIEILDAALQGWRP